MSKGGAEMKRWKSTDNLLKKIVSGTVLTLFLIIIATLPCNIQPAKATPSNFDLTISSTAGGNVTTPGEGIFTYDSGMVVDLVATPDAGYRFVNWTGDVDTIADINAAATNITMSGNYSITANFKRCDLTTSSTEGGSVTTPGEGIFTYDWGTVVDLVAASDAGYRFVNWTGDVDTVADVNTAVTNITMNGDYSITANFIKRYDLFINSTSGGWVTTPGEGTFIYDAGTVVNLVATPSRGYRFANWTGDVGTVANVNAARTAITMNGNYFITANFESGYPPMVAAGDTHTVGLKYDGTVVAVGDNYIGQCDVGNWTDIVEVSAGNGHTVGLKSDGTVVAVGSDMHGECEVDGWTDMVHVAAGGFHTVGVKSDGTVVAVGYNYSGQCNVGNWTDIIQVAAGGHHTVGLKSDGTVVAVGYNDDGQCNVTSWTDIIQVAAGSEIDGDHTVGLKSDGTVVATSSWQSLVGGWTDIVQVAAGRWHTVGLKWDGTVVAVGENTAGQCDVGGWSDVIQVAAGGAHTVGLTSYGRVVGTGRSFYGECDVEDWTDIAQVDAGGSHTVGLKSDGTVVAVGWNYWGACEVSGWTDIVQVAAGGSHTVGLKSDGTVVATSSWQSLVGGWTDIVQVAAGGALKSDGTVVAGGDNNVGGWTDIVQVAAGSSHTVGVKSDGTVVAVGPNTQGQCEVGGWTNITQVATGELHTVGLRNDGSVVAAGYNYSGQCNVGNWTNIVQVAAGWDHTVGLKSDGTVVAVGWDTEGQCDVGNWTNIIQVAAGTYHTVGLKSNGTVVAAGPEIELAKILLLIRAKLHSPAEFRVRDSQDHVTGVTNGEIRDEIRWATFNQEDESITVLYGFGTYFYEVEGTGSGSYGLTVNMDDEGHITTFTATNIPITSGAIHRYHVDWNALSNGEEGVTVEVDSDGDGVFEKTFTAGSVLTGEPMPLSQCVLTISSATGGNVTTPGEGVFTYDAGTVVNLVATPDASYHFVNWTGDVSTIGDVNAAATNITMSGNYSITANFEEIPPVQYDLSINSTEGGSVTTPGEGVFTHDEGEVVDLVATPDVGYRFVNWTGDVGAIADVEDATTTITMDGDYAVTANFAVATRCFIATAAYGTPMAEEIQILREFRDEYLLTNPLGQAFVDFYYKVSPPIAEFITEHPSLKPIVRAGLAPAVAMSTVAVDTTSAEKIAMVGLLVLPSVALAVWATRRRGRGSGYT
jgi:alpha-tubulin suppressor-like RCC1 family protein